MLHDFAQMRAAYPILSVCKLLGITLKRTGAKYHGKCPVCGRNAFKVTPSKALWWCFSSCDRGGDALDLVVRVKRLDHKQAAEFIVQGLGRR